MATRLFTTTKRGNMNKKLRAILAVSLWVILGVLVSAKKYDFPVGSPFDAGGGNMEVPGTLDVYDQATFGNEVTVPGGSFTIGNWRQDNSVETLYGDDFDFFIGYVATENELRVGRGFESGTDAAVAFRVTASTVVAIGDTGSMGATMDESGDLFVEKDIDIDGQLNVGGNAVVTGGLWMTGYLKAGIADTETNLKASTPNNVGFLYYDTTNKAVIVSTAATVGGFGMIYDGTQLPTGW